MIHFKYNYNIEWHVKKSVILPTYNERENIGPLIETIIRCLDGDLEIIVVDDDSPDGTWEVVENIKDDKVKLLRRIGKRGLASAIKEGIEGATGEVVAVMDTDLSHPPEKLTELFNTLDHCDIVVGSRYVKGGGMEASMGRLLVSQLTNLFARTFLVWSIHDYTGGFIACRRKVFNKITISDERGTYGDYCIALLFDAINNGLKVEEIPYIYKFRVAGETKTSPDIFKLFKWGILYCGTILKLRLRSPKTKI